MSRISLALHTLSARIVVAFFYEAVLPSKYRRMVVPKYELGRIWSGHDLLEIHAVFACKDRKTCRTTKILSVQVTRIQIEATNHGLPNTFPKCSIDNVAFH
jgi:hypothetical protein